MTLDRITAVAGAITKLATRAKSTSRTFLSGPAICAIVSDRPMASMLETTNASVKTF